jgi:hypothetical protein
MQSRSRVLIHFTKNHLIFLIIGMVALAILSACGGDSDQAPAGNTGLSASTPTAGQASASTPEPAQGSVTEAPAIAGTPQVAEIETAVPPVVDPTATASETSVADDPYHADEPADVDEPLPEPDNPAPELASTGTWYNTEPLSLNELRGNPVLLVFWATY